MSLEMRRIVLFTKDMAGMTAFYRDVLGLKQRSDEPGWKDFEAGGCNIALHNGTSEPGRRPPKIVFYARDVAAMRDALNARGARFGKVKEGKGLVLCDGKDPDGNPVGLSNRA